MGITNILIIYILLVSLCVLLNLFFLEYKTYYINSIENRRKYWLNFFKKCIKTKIMNLQKKKLKN